MRRKNEYTCHERMHNLTFVRSYPLIHPCLRSLYLKIFVDIERICNRVFHTIRVFSCTRKMWLFSLRNACLWIWKNCYLHLLWFIGSLSLTFMRYFSFDTTPPTIYKGQSKGFQSYSFMDGVLWWLSKSIANVQSRNVDSINPPTLSPLLFFVQPVGRVEYNHIVQLSTWPLVDLIFLHV